MKIVGNQAKIFTPQDREELRYLCEMAYRDDIARTGYLISRTEKGKSEFIDKLSATSIIWSVVREKYPSEEIDAIEREVIDELLKQWPGGKNDICRES